jgi:hypothetical protein
MIQISERRCRQLQRLKADIVQCLIIQDLCPADRKDCILALRRHNDCQNEDDTTAAVDIHNSAEAAKGPITLNPLLILLDTCTTGSGIWVGRTIHSSAFSTS